MTEPRDTCAKLLRAHFHAASNGCIEGYKPSELQDHWEAWCSPSRKEAGIVHLLKAYAAIADQYERAFPGSLLGDDGYFGEHARDLLKAAQALLNIEVGNRFCRGLLDRLIGQLAAASGVELT